MTWKTALITGASSGIGRAFAQQLAESGTDLVLVARSRDELADLASELRSAHDVHVEVLAADLTVDADLARVAKRVRQQTRPVDLLLNNAGTGTVGPLAELPLEREEQVVRLNGLAVLRLSGAAARAMRDRGSGTILNMASLAAYAPIPYFAVYSASKAFILTLTLALREELRGSGVSVTALCPGFVDTDFGDKAGVRRPPGRFLYTDVDTVVRAGLKGAAGGRAVVLPGPAVRVAGAVAKLGPQVVLSRVAASVARTLAAGRIAESADNAQEAPSGPPPDQVIDLDAEGPVRA